MGYKRLRKIRPGVPWRRRHTFNVATFAVNVVAHRTFDKGRDVKDKAFKPYSTSPIYIPSKGVQPKARGGRLAAKRLKRGSKTEYATRGRYFSGGYREYKAKAVGSATVTLTASGALRRSFRVLQTSVKKDRAHIGIAGDPERYGLALNKDRRWFGFSPKDRVKIRRYFRMLIRRSMR